MSFNNATAPVIFGCSAYTLTSEERTFFATHQPKGFILFRRNLHDKDQLQGLIEELKSTLNTTNPPILIDQEGGRVARLSAPYWFHPPSSALLAKGKLEEARQRVHETYAKIAEELNELGINTNCAPVLDLFISEADPIMGDRTFSSDPEVVAELGTVAIKALQAGGITPIMKHIPGHGAATCDSHKALPIVNLSFKDLQAHFAPFKANAHCPWAMTAHIIYTTIDPHHPATQSFPVIQEIIRKEIGFQGVLISDDIGMNALSGSFSHRARTSLEAGCDLVLHCSGIMKEMIEVMDGANSFTALFQRKVL